MLRLWKSVVVVVMVVVGSATALAGVSSSSVEPTGVEQHCVVEVVDQLKSGEFVLSDPVCFETFAEAASFASSGAVQLPAGVSPADLGASGQEALLATFTLGVHYDGYSGGGASISVVGSNCGGGYWNTSTAWDNRISSTWNGCHRIKHHDNPYMSGSYRSTWGVGSVSNVPSSLNNKAESVSYWTS